jgi:hypothetical protein
VVGRLGLLLLHPSRVGQKGEPTVEQKQQHVDEQEKKRKEHLASGLFSAICGVVFLAIFVIVVSFNLDPSKISPEVLFDVWMVIAAVILLGWGFRRILETAKKKPEWVETKVQPRVSMWIPGQPTIIFVVTILGATFAIIALLVAPH